jgi:hypothetical protein
LSLRANWNTHEIMLAASIRRLGGRCPSSWWRPLAVSSATILLMMFCASILFLIVLPHLRTCREFVNSVSCIKNTPRRRCSSWASRAG